MNTLIIIILFFIAVVFLLIIKNKSFSQSSKGACFICDQVFLDKDLMEIKGKFFCSKDSRVFIESEWQLVKTTFVSPSKTRDATLLQDIKEELKKHNIPSYIESTYLEDKNEITTKSDLYLRISDLGTAKEFIA